MIVGAPQQILSGKYRLERELGRGGMGSVWLAQHLTLRSPVAIKLIDPQIASNAEALGRFLREAQSAASLRSPHVVQILDHGVDEGVPFIVMELLEGEALSSRIEHRRRLSPQETSHILTQVARAMTRAHEAGIVHRDLKPENIYLVRNDEEEVAKVLDFGIAKAHTHGVGAVSGATRTGSVLGTPYYMSPEQAEGSKLVDHRTDLWAMGVIAWECLLGRKPFDEETLGGLLLAICAREMPIPSRMGPVPPGFDAWFARACSRDLAYRFSSARELAAELRKICAATDVPFASASELSPSSGAAVPASSLPLASTTGQLSLSASPYKPPGKSKTPLIGLGLLALAVVGAGLAFALRGGDPAQTVVAASATERTVATSAAPQVMPPAEPATKPEASPAPPAASSAAAVPPAPRTSSAKVTPRVASKPRPGPAAKVETVKPAAPAPAAPAPPAKPRVNLGI